MSPLTKKRPRKDQPLRASHARSQTTTSETIYTPLDPELKEIRLIQIAPGRYDDDLRIRLRVHKLEKGGLVFNALSYVWGYEKCRREAILDGHCVTIGRNLDSALRCLRDDLIGRLLWVDALCINQEDIEERNQQVQLMRSIYSSATRVMIWLSARLPTDDFVIHHITRNTIPATTREAILLLRALKRICLRPWFERTWVVQEMALAKESPTLHLGQRSVQWDQFGYYIGVLYNMLENNELGASWPRKSLDAFVFPSHRMMSYWNYDLMELLAATFALQATDPRDKVYGILGFGATSLIRHTIVPDYFKSVEQVFLEISRIAVQTGGIFPYLKFPLHGRSGDRARIACVGLPSWAFNLTEKSAKLSPRGLMRNLRKTQDFESRLSGPLKQIQGLPECSRFSPDLKRLHTYGLHTGTVTYSSTDLLHVPPVPSLTCYRDLALRLHNVYREIFRPQGIPGSAMIEAFDLTWNDKEDMIIFDRLWQGLEDLDEPLGEGCMAVLRQFVVGVRGRILFVTEEGDVGALYHPEPLTAVQPGDVVVGLFGINFPFVLRPIVEEPGDGQTYAMVNIAHVANHEYGHDFVRNAESDAEWRDFEKFGMREYTIV
ncbi:hypothetical protein DPSP01_003483 [Paraphaeosphaeria sporulosa]